MSIRMRLQTVLASRRFPNRTRKKRIEKRRVGRWSPEFNGAATTGSYAMEIQRMLRAFCNRSWVNISYFVLQAMVMWGNDRRMEFDRNAKILRMNFVIDLLSYEDNSCRYAISANIQQRLINIAKKD
ncbi:hypothetical protein ZEAMMB73_Zm00001d030669 [Zea mays]|uniref:Uncharacterized protein n=1 Tax=Zea mays TaxID=4577 RepID=A0A1D6KDV5_MAIZE|nr:hypothetical protein ZEAMMB73_Zm00001d030669 [Zea mays]